MGAKKAAKKRQPSKNDGEVFYYRESPGWGEGGGVTAVVMGIYPPRDVLFPRVLFLQLTHPTRNKFARPRVNSLTLFKNIKVIQYNYKLFVIL